MGRVHDKGGLEMTDHDTIIRFLNLISQVDDYDEAKDYLSDSGFDINEVKAEGEEFLTTIKAQADLKLAKRKKDLLNQAKDLLADKVYSDPKEELIRIFKGLSPGLSVQFSKIEKLDEKDAQELLKEEELLNLLQKLEDDESGRE